MAPAYRALNVRLDKETAALLDKLVAHYDRLQAPVTQSWVAVAALRELARSVGVLPKNNSNK